MFFWATAWPNKKKQQEVHGSTPDRFFCMKPAHFEQRHPHVPLLQRMWRVHDPVP